MSLLDSIIVGPVGIIVWLRVQGNICLLSGNSYSCGYDWFLGNYQDAIFMEIRNTIPFLMIMVLLILGIFFFTQNHKSGQSVFLPEPDLSIYDVKEINNGSALQGIMFMCLWSLRWLYFGWKDFC